MEELTHLQASRKAFKATISKFLVSHFIDLKNTCGRAVHYPLFIISISTKFLASSLAKPICSYRNVMKKTL